MRQFLHYLTLGYLLNGVVVTVEITAGAFLVGLLGGAVVAAVQLMRVPFLSGLVRVLSLITRGTPVLLQLLFVFDVLPTVGIRLPGVTTAIIVLGVNTTTFFSEIMRGSVLSIERGQTMAAQSLGMSPRAIARHIVSPQAVRIALPQLANQTVVLILTSSLGSTISVPELTMRSQTISSSNFQVVPVYVASGVMYLALTSIVSGLQVLLERSLSLDRTAPVPGRTPISRRSGKGASFARQSLAQLTGIPARVAAGPDQALSPAAFEGAPLEIPDRIAAADTSPDLVIGERELQRALTVEFVSPATKCEGPILELEGLSKRYGTRWALRGIDLSVGAGEVVVVMGPSGCGKSTLLRCVAQLESLDGGDVFVAGERFGRDNLGRPLKGRHLAEARARARIAMVFQSFELFKHMSARRNVTVALETVHREAADKANERARGLLRTVGLEGHAESRPRQLSGGQQQRVAIARALATSPRLMLLDEPTSALDPEMVHEVLTVLRALAAAGMTMLIVTHEVKFAMEIADRIVFLANGQIVECSRPDEVRTSPEREATRNFLQLLEV